MKWPWKRSTKQKAEMALLDQEVRESEAAKEESGIREEKVREVHLEALALLRTSREMARENHFGEMIDDALGIGKGKHA